MFDYYKLIGNLYNLLSTAHFYLAGGLMINSNPKPGGEHSYTCPRRRWAGAKSAPQALPHESRVLFDFTCALYSHLKLSRILIFM